MAKNRRNSEDSLRILLTFVGVFLCTADSQTVAHNITTTISGISETSATAVATVTPNAATAFSRAGTLHATASAPGHPAISSPSPDSIDVTPSELICLQGWALFLICSGTTVAVFLLASVMLCCFRRCRHLTPQQCPQQYNQADYVAPEEQAIELK